MKTSAPTLLVVDDEARVRAVVGEFAERAGFTVSEAATGREALVSMRDNRIDVALVDLCMPDLGGLDVLRAVRQDTPWCRTIVMTGFGSVETAVEAIQHGAVDYLQKPVNFTRLSKLLRNMRNELEVASGPAAVRTDIGPELCGMIGSTPAMQELFMQVQRLAQHARVVLVTGETGTGKELVAKALHQLGSRRTKKFVPLNCSAVVDTLVESELFGHVRGAFTGAHDQKPGLFESANGGTLFLDEVGELPLAAQAKLLRVLELGEVRRVGSLESRTVDVHVIAATNRDLEQEIAAGRFRRDLYYRLNVIGIGVPPLRDRREDVAPLAARFIADCATRLSKPLDGLTPAAERALLERDWRGNVRELRNVIERASILAAGRLIDVQELGEGETDKSLEKQIAAATITRRPAQPRPALTREDVEQALERAGGNKMVAAQILGLSRRAFYRQLEHWNLGDTIVRRAKKAVGPSDDSVPVV
jgi:DNA-binding NtrC family response regulator